MEETMTVDEVLAELDREMRLYFQINPDTGNVRHESFSALPTNMLFYCSKTVGAKRLTQGIFQYADEIFQRDCVIAKAFYDLCTSEQRTTVVILVSEIIDKDRWRKSQAEALGTESRYIDPIDQGNFFGGPLIALSEAFGLQDELLAA